MTSEITWKGQPDDQTAKVGDYILRVEELDYEVWWWCVYFKDERIERNPCTSSRKAKTACEKAYREHLTNRHDK